MSRRLSPLHALIALLVLGLAAPVAAGQVNMKKLKKWPELDRAWARSFDAWMTNEELKIFLQLGTTDERQKFLVDAGYWKLWKRIDKEMVPKVIEGDVLVGMTKDEVFMCWDKPKKIRKDFRKDAYVDVFNYEFEIDRKGREFLLRGDSQTAYRNEIVVKYVYMYNGQVFNIVYAGEEENAMDELPIDEARPAPAPADEAAGADDASDLPEGGAGEPKSAGE